MNRFLILTKPGPHKVAMLKPFHQTAEFCSVCHKVGIPQEVNDYRFLRGQDEYDNWHNSGVSGNSARSFYYPEASKTCLDCHMPLVESKDPAGAKRGGKVRNHQFLAANSALPYLKGYSEHLKQLEKFMQDNKVTLDIFTMKQLATDGRKLIAPLDKMQSELNPGDEVIIEVVVRNKGVGHSFPGGTIDSNEVWVEFTALDESGRILFVSGNMDKEGYVDPSAHFYRAQMVDRHANLANKRNVPIDAVATVYARVIPPGTTDVVRYKFSLPEDFGGAVTLTAKLHYRKFDRWYTNWVFASQQDPETQDGYTRLVDDSTYVFSGRDVPTLPVITMAEDRVVLSVDQQDAPNSPLPTSHSPLTQDWERFNDYGIGLLRQGNIRGATRAFESVVQLNSGYADGPINLARAAIANGDLTLAEEHLLKALSIDKRNHKVHLFLALVYKGHGRYEKAIKELKIVKDEFPQDRVVINDIGRIQILKGDYAEAITNFKETLLIDPEHVCRPKHH